MARVTSEQYLDFGGWQYAVVTQYRSGHKVLCNIKSVYPWCILFPDNSIMRFKSENELWQYVIDHKLFLNEKGDKMTWVYQS